MSATAGWFWARHMDPQGPWVPLLRNEKGQIRLVHNLGGKREWGSKVNPPVPGGSKPTTEGWHWWRPRPDCEWRPMGLTSWGAWGICPSAVSGIMPSDDMPGEWGGECRREVDGDTDR